MQVEQDLILSRVIVEIFSDPFLAKELAFRGGTALHKLFFSPSARYSEDIDLARISTGPIKNIIDVLRNRLELWLGKPKTERTNRSFKLLFYFNPETSLIYKLRVKIEINIQECFSVLPRLTQYFSIQSDWFTAQAPINTFQFEELIATKLRALYERHKGRDVFDLWLALKRKDFDVHQVIAVFLHYMKRENKLITRKLFEENLALKLKEPSFTDDIGQLLSLDLIRVHSTTRATGNKNLVPETYSKKLISENWNLIESAEKIKTHILSFLP